MQQGANRRSRESLRAIDIKGIKSKLSSSGLVDGTEGPTRSGQKTSSIARESVMAIPSLVNVAERRSQIKDLCEKSQGPRITVQRPARTSIRYPQRTPPKPRAHSKPPNQQPNHNKQVSNAPYAKPSPNRLMARSDPIKTSHSSHMATENRLPIIKPSSQQSQVQAQTWSVPSSPSKLRPSSNHVESSKQPPRPPRKDSPKIEIKNKTTLERNTIDSVCVDCSPENTKTDTTEDVTSERSWSDGEEVEDSGSFLWYEEASFLQSLQDLEVTIAIFIPEFLIRKTIRVPITQQTSDVIELASRNVNTHSTFYAYLPRTGIILPNDRPLYTFQLLHKDQLELVTKATSISGVKSVTIKNKIDDTEEQVPYTPQTTVRGIWQLMKRKHIEGESRYGLFSDTGMMLDPTRPLTSSACKNNIIHYKRLPERGEENYRKGSLLLKILLVEACGSKLIKLDRSFTIDDAIYRIGTSLKIEKSHLKFYRLFIPLGAPLEANAVLGELDLHNNDILEFKKLPPHLLQRYTNKQEHQVLQEGENFPTNILDWNSDIVCLWLAKIGYGELVSSFREKDINGEALFKLTADTLRDDFSIPELGIRKGLLREVRKLAVQTQINLQMDMGTPHEDAEASELFKKLLQGPLLSISDSYEVEERDVVNLSDIVVELMIKQLQNAKAWEHEGIFRLSGSRAVVERVYNSLKNAHPNFEKANVHDLASSFKHYLRSLDDPLIPMTQYDSFIISFNKDEATFDLNALREAVNNLPAMNKKCAKQLVKLCSQISDFKDSNKMNSYNLGIVFGPTIMRSRDPYIDFSNSDVHAKMFKCMIDNFSSVF